MSGNGLLRQRNLFILVSIVVPVFLLITFVVFPVIELFRMSLTDWNGLSASRNYIGLDNFQRMFNDKDLLLSLRNNAIYFFVHLVFIPIELAVAAILITKMQMGGFYKSMVFLPFIINGVAIAYTFSYFFSPINGGFNAILKAVGLQNFIQNWLSNEKIVNFVLASISLWRYSGYHVILFIAAFTSIPRDTLEAAIIDGANIWQKFRFIQIPSITLVIDFILFDNVRGALQAFDIPFIITSGGPGYASSTFTLYTINTAFTYNNFGLAGAMAVGIMMMIVIVYLIQSFVVKNFREQSIQRYTTKNLKMKKES
jgi:multiple sugar transport system permease protein